MAVAYITPRDFLFWLRSHTAKEIKWGGAKNHPADKDDGQRTHPRSSFKAFLEVGKSRSLPWENAEMDAIHSLQLILRDSFREAAEGTGNSKAMINTQFRILELRQIDELSSVAREMVRLIETATTPIFAVDADGRINGWNAKVAELTGLPVDEAMGKSLVKDLVFKGSADLVDKLLYRALRGPIGNVFDLENEHSPNSNPCRTLLDRVVMDKFIHMQGDYKSIVHSPNPLIPPIFASDEKACCSEWNAAMERLTGWSRGEMIGKLLVGEVSGSCCRLKGSNALTKFMIVLRNAIGGQETDKFPFAFFDKNGKFVQALLTANTRSNLDGQMTGAFCFVQAASPELQQALEIQRQ